MHFLYFRCVLYSSLSCVLWNEATTRKLKIAFPDIPFLRQAAGRSTEYSTQQCYTMCYGLHLNDLQAFFRDSNERIVTR